MAVPLTSASNLRCQFGVGPLTAATLPTIAGDNPERMKNEAALVSFCGVEESGPCLFIQA
ncbi:MULTISPECIES: transposase [Klebsiella]|uniref:transposase n=1 Tax=Klebsiella TaxID=570 RepID=UPI00094E0E94|nr:transposase [Klebsiella oxytoca]MDI0395753.1 transposase [Raoultella ornithinolytica]MDI0424456.1 transposase [Raoultella ornithinolytica]MDI0442035.1 transposase [Raoultella ornithinolytica]MDI0448492.1 transposase [Raoultella ornithinolytica]MDI9190077.1 transposase [Raoultella ornithinolytica]